MPEDLEQKIKEQIKEQRLFGEELDRRLKLLEEKIKKLTPEPVLEIKKPFREKILNSYGEITHLYFEGELLPLMIGKFGAGQTTRTTAQGTGTQNVAHGLGVTPKLIKITAFFQRSGDTAGEGAICVGSSLGATGETCSYMYFGAGSTFGGYQNSGNIIYIKDESTDTEHVVCDISAVDSTNFTLNFTTFSALGTNINTLFIQWEAWA